MPVTFVPSAPNGIVGPGIPFTITWPEAPSPLPQTFVGLTVYADEAEQNLAWSETYQATAFPFQANMVLTDPQNSFAGIFTLKDGDSCYVHLRVVPIGFPTETDDHFLHWSLAGVPQMIQKLNLATQGGVGLTPTEAQQLQELHAAAVPVTNFDGMALISLTNGVPVSSLETGLAEALSGIIVRISQIPPDLLPISGDPNYWRPTLAQVSIYRSNDLWLRFPCHSTNRMFLLPGNELAAGVAETIGLSWLLNMHLTLTTFPGVLAEVLTMHTP